MKKMEFFCTSRGSTAVCSSLHDRKKPQLLHIPCLSQLPVNPKPQFEKHRKGGFSSDHNLRRKSSADVDDLRSLLGDSPFIDWFTDPPAGDFPADQPPEKKKIALSSNGYRAPKAKPPSLSRSMTVHECRGIKSRSLVSQQQSPALRTSSPACSRDQVVVLKVSLHCKGCEGKVKKHLSKMEGVTSFSVDFTTKKVTIIGDVSPLGVLASVSKVKHAQLWPSPTPSSSQNAL